jgi:pimeloyl-ACP methyl ester carboxylesterase
VAAIDIGTTDVSDGSSSGASYTLQLMHDAKAAIRFFRKDAATADLYGSEPDNIIVGGHSAMGSVSGYVTYLDDPAKGSRQQVIAANGGLEGDRGNPGYDSSVAGWVCLAGCLPAEHKDWITATSPPLLGVYGSEDTGVPFGERMFTILGKRAVWAGAASLYKQAMSVGLTQSRLFVIEGGDHMSAIDPSNEGLINAIAQFVRSL